MKKRKTYEISVIDKTYSKTISDETKFYTSDTALELGFELKGTEYNFESAEIVLLNIDDRSLVTRPVSKVNNDFVYELDDDIIPHYGEWHGQLRFEAGETYVSSPVKFRIENDLSNDRPPQLSDVQSWVSLKRYADGLIDELKQAVLSIEGVEDTFNTNELERQNQFTSAEQSRQATFEANEIERAETFETNENTRQIQELEREKAETQRATAESVRVANEAKRISKDSNRDSKIEEVENSIVGKKIGGYTFNGNTEVRVTNLDEETGVFTATNHGLANGMRCSVTLNLNTPIINKTSLPDPLQVGWRYIINTTQDTFQMSNSRDGEPVIFTPNPSLDTNLWHLEATNSPVTSINLQGFSETELTIKFMVKSHAQGSNVFKITLDGMEMANNFYSQVEGLLTRDLYPALLNYGHSNLAMFGEYKASLYEHTMIGNLDFYRADLATGTNPHSNIPYKVFKDTIWATNTNKIDAFRGVGLSLGGHMLLNGSTLEVYNG